MLKYICLCMIIWAAFCTYPLKAQDAQIRCFTESSESSSFRTVRAEVDNAILSESTFFEVVIFAVDKDSPTQLPGWFYPLFDELPVFFWEATFNKFEYQPIVLTKDSQTAFEMPTPYVTTFPGGCEHVHLKSNMENVLQQADNIYDFSLFDFNGDGKVYVHFTSLGPRGGGVSGTCLTYNSVDNVQVIVYQQSRGSNEDIYRGVFFHESGHTFFNFPDMDHLGSSLFDHYGIGSFDIMSGGGFQGVPSAYNPWFRHARGWYEPITIGQNGTKEFVDFQKQKKAYLYEPSTLPGNAITNQKFYISYHHPNENHYYSRWPYKNRTVGGVLIWHVKKHDSQLSKSGDYSNWRRMDINIEYASGKFIWGVDGTGCPINTYQENALTGRDSLEIRKVSGKTELCGPFYGRDRGGPTAFFTPNDGKGFTYYTNPNSNFYVNSSQESYAQSITSGFSVKNFREINGVVEAEFFIDDYTITENTTLSPGKWYIQNTITVSNGVTLTILPGTQIMFQNGKSLIINGKLIANGTSSQPITLTRSGSSGSWGPIVLNGSGASGSTLNYVKMTHGTEVQVINTSNVTISNSRFENTSYGIRFSNSTGSANYNKMLVGGGNYGIRVENGSNVTVNINEIKQKSFGISYTGGSFGYMGGNDVVNTSNGVSISNSSNPRFKNVPNAYSKNNRISYNSIVGLSIYNSFPVMYDGMICNGKQSITNNAEVDLYYYHSGGYYLDAIGVYWNGGNPANAIIIQGHPSSPIWTFPYLTTDPWSGVPLPSIQDDEVPDGMILASISSLGTSANSTQSVALDSASRDPLLEGIQLQEEGRFVEAMDFFISYLEENPNSHRAYTELYNCYSDETADKIVSYFESLPITGGEEKLLLNYLYLKQGKVASAKDVNNTIISRDGSTTHSMRANLNNFYIALYHEDDPKTAAALLNNIERQKELLDETEVLFARYALETYVGPDGLKGEDYLTPESEDISSTKVYKIEIDQNYPNPFNPTTVISFSLPETDRITLRVYDIIGRVVAVLADDVYESGRHEVAFDASRLSSGMYFYTLTTSANSITKRLLLVK